ncbi:uncharacterized protein V6R79_003986 [Siganus canaliculatus]
MATVEKEGQGLAFMNLHLPDRLKKPSMPPRQSCYAYSVELTAAGPESQRGEDEAQHMQTNDDNWTGQNDMDETVSGRSIKRKCRHNTDWRGCSSFDSGARFHGRFTVPFA